MFLFLKLVVSFRNENWKEFFILQVVERYKRTPFRNELWKMKLLDFLQHKLLRLTGGRLEWCLVL